MTWADFSNVTAVLGSASDLMTVSAGGRFALTRYRREVRLRAADLLLKMEEEFRQVAPTCVDIEYLGRYKERLVPVLNKMTAGEDLTDCDAKVVGELDRCLRFFFVCTVLNSDLEVEETAIGRAYYYYVCLLAEPDKRIELRAYITRCYSRLDHWMKSRKRCMELYRATGYWDEALVNRN